MSRIGFRLLLAAGIFIGCLKESEAEPAPRDTPPHIDLTITNVPANRNTDDAKTHKAIEVKDAGVLRIAFPTTWDDKLARVPTRDRFFDSIMFWPHSTNGDFDFELMVDVNYVGDTAASRVNIKEVLQRAGQAELTNSVETKLDIHEFQGQQTKGCYFAVTDKNYNPDHHAKTDYRYLTQGYAELDGLILSFRLVSNHLPPEQEQMLEMIKTARFEKKQ
jgi:hypothetical protein